MVNNLKSGRGKIMPNKDLKQEVQIELLFEKLIEKHGIKDCSLSFNYNPKNTSRMGYCKHCTKGKTPKYEIAICLNHPIVKKWEKDSDFKRLILHEFAHAVTAQDYGVQKRCHNSVWLDVYNALRKKENLKDIQYPRYK